MICFQGCCLAAGHAPLIANVAILRAHDRVQRLWQEGVNPGLDSDDHSAVAHGRRTTPD